MLSLAQIEHYRTEGYLILPNFIEKIEVEALRTAVDRLIGAAPVQPGAQLDLQGNPVSFPGDFSFTNLGERGHVLNRLSQPLWHSTTLLRTYGHPKLLAAATDLYGAELVPFAESIVIKLPHNGSPFAWHQDGSFKSGPVPERGVNFGLYLHRADQDNGCLFVVPQSHRQGQLDLKDLPVDTPPPGAIAVPAAPGDVVVHSRNLVHGSLANTSDRIRVTVYFGYHTIKTVESLYGREHIEYRRQVVGLAIKARQESALFAAEEPFSYGATLPAQPTPSQREQILRAAPLAV